jgi:hypothetical protein
MRPACGEDATPQTGARRPDGLLRAWARRALPAIERAVAPLARVLRAIAWTAALAGCGGGAEIETRVAERAPSLPEALRQGMVIAPCFVPGPRSDAGSVASAISQELSRQLQLESMVELGGARLVLPEDVQTRAAANPTPASLLAAVQRMRAGGEPVAQQRYQDLRAWLGCDQLLLTWLDEQDERGSQILIPDIHQVPWPLDGGTVPYTVVKGVLWGELVDLRRGQPLWRGDASYATGRRTPAQARYELPGFRTKAVTALVRLLVKK